MYDKVHKYWKIYLKDFQAKLVKCKESEKKELEEKIKFMEETDMAVVVSQSQNEIEDFKKKDLDIAAHRKRIIKEDLDKKFKDSDDPLRIVFVCAMWMTGFDVPSCSTIYLDKPMRNHTLMQTIARANRVFGDKLNGLIVDYVGVFRNLQKALAIYGSGTGGGIEDGETPVKDKGVLVEQLKSIILETTAFCTERGIAISKIQAVYGFQRVKLIDDAIDAILTSDESKAKYLSMAANVVRIYRSILPDPSANEFGQMQMLFAIIAEKIRSLAPETDITEVMNSVENLLDESIATEGYVIRESSDEYRLVDLSHIDFEALKVKFEKSHRRIEAEKLRSAINRKLVQMVRLNKSRVNYLEKF
jgi:type I restriction enzyme R subunit